MPVLPQNLVHVVLRGSLDVPGDTGEQFQHGFYMHLDAPGGMPPPLNWHDVTQALAEGIRDKWAAAWAPLQSSFPSTVNYQEVRAYHLDDETGHMLDRGQSSFDGTIKGSGTTSLPYECALAVTLYGYTAGSQSGQAAARRRNRMYLPALSGAVVDVTGMLTAAKQNTLASGLDSFFETAQGIHAMNDASINVHFDVVTVSRADVAFHQVERTAVGRVIDVQRRRRNKLKEAYLVKDLSHE